MLKWIKTIVLIWLAINFLPPILSVPEKALGRRVQANVAPEVKSLMRRALVSSLAAEVMASASALQGRGISVRACLESQEINPNSNRTNGFKAHFSEQLATSGKCELRNQPEITAYVDFQAKLDNYLDQRACLYTQGCTVTAQEKERANRLAEAQVQASGGFKSSIWSLFGALLLFLLIKVGPVVVAVKLFKRGSTSLRAYLERVGATRVDRGKLVEEKKNLLAELYGIIDHFGPVADLVEGYSRETNAHTYPVFKRLFPVDAYKVLYMTRSGEERKGAGNAQDLIQKLERVAQIEAILAESAPQETTKLMLLKVLSEVWEFVASLGSGVVNLIQPWARERFQQASIGTVVLGILLCVWVAAPQRAGELVSNGATAAVLTFVSESDTFMEGSSPVVVESVYRGIRNLREVGEEVRTPTLGVFNSAINSVGGLIGRGMGMVSGMTGASPANSGGGNSGVSSTPGLDVFPANTSPTAVPSSPSKQKKAELNMDNS